MRQADATSASHVRLSAYYEAAHAGNHRCVTHAQSHTTLYIGDIAPQHAGAGHVGETSTKGNYFYYCAMQISLPADKSHRDEKEEEGGNDCLILTEGGATDVAGSCRRCNYRVVSRGVAACRH